MLKKLKKNINADFTNICERFGDNKSVFPLAKIRINLYFMLLNVT